MKQTRPITINELMQLWLETKRLTLKQASYATYLRVVKASIIPVIGNVEVDEITQDKLQDFVNRLSARGISEKSIWDINSKLNAALNWAAEQHYIEHAGFCVKTRFQKVESPQVLSKVETETLKSYLSHSDGKRNIKVGILLCLECGLKVGELGALRFESFDWRQGILTVNKRLQRMVNMNATGKKTEVKVFPVEPRQIPLSYELVGIIQSLKRTGPSAYFLTGRADKYIEPRLLQMHLKSYLKACGLDESIGFNTLRSSYISNALKNGEDIGRVGKLIGAKRLAHIKERYRLDSFEQSEPIQKYVAL